MTSPTSNPSSDLRARFEGAGGRLRLIDVIREQFLVQGDVSLAERFADSSTLIEIPKEQKLIEQEACDNDIYLILGGSFGVYVNGRITANRAAGTHVGEMAAIDPTSRRSSTVIAHEHSLVAKLPLQNFESICGSYPLVWRKLAVDLSRRLKERNKFHRAPRSQPVIFIGSTVEALSVAREIQANFQHDPVVAKVWTNGIFTPGSTTIEDLVKLTSECDFAVLVVTPDDKIVVRGENYDAPRDNVIFELGLLVGSIGRERTFMAIPRGCDVKIPTDLLGVTPLSYDASKPSWPETQIPVLCNEVRKLVKKLGPL